MVVAGVKRCRSPRYIQYLCFAFWRRREREDFFVMNKAEEMELRGISGIKRGNIYISRAISIRSWLRFQRRTITQISYKNSNLWSKPSSTEFILIKANWFFLHIYIQYEVMSGFSCGRCSCKNDAKVVPFEKSTYEFTLHD